jgi:hypothetical protein
MNKRREVMRTAGWLAVLSGALTMAAAALTDSIGLDLLGAYGLLFTLTGGWALVGIHILARHERVAAEREVATAAAPNRTSVLGR